MLSQPERIFSAFHPPSIPARVSNSARDAGKTDAAGGPLTRFEYLDKPDAGNA